jgi:hypothetical protein
MPNPYPQPHSTINQLDADLGQHSDSAAPAPYEAPKTAYGTPATTVTGPDAFGATATVGTGLLYARNDHNHGLPAGIANPLTGDLAAGGYKITGLADPAADQDAATKDYVDDAASLLQSAVVKLTTGDLTTASATFVDAVGLTITLTTGAHRCLVFFTALVGGDASLDIAIDGVAQNQQLFVPGGTTLTGSTIYLTPVLSSGLHTIKIIFKTGGTAIIYAEAGTPATLTILETGLAV